MIAFYIKDEALDLFTDFSISFTFSSPIFTNQGFYSYPIKIPYTVKNAKILNFINRIASTVNVYEDFPCRISVNGMNLVGTFHCTIANKDKFEGCVFVMNGDFNYSIKNKHLDTIDFGGIGFENEQEALDFMNSTMTLYYPDVPFALPQIKNDQYFEPPTSNDLLRWYNNRIYNNQLVLSDPGTNERTIIIPFLYLRFVLKKVFEGLGYDIIDNVFEKDSELSRLLLYNSCNCNGRPGQLLIYYFITHVHYNMHIPRVLIKEFLTGLETFLNIRFFIDSMKKTVQIVKVNDILSNSNLVEFSNNIISESIELEEQIAGFTLKMNLDSDDSSYDSILAYDNAILDIYKGSVDKISDLPNWPSDFPGSLFFVKEKGIFYWLYGNLMLPDTIPFDGLKTVFVNGTGTTKIESSFSTMYSNYDPVWFRCSCTNKRDNKENISPRLVFANILSGGMEGVYQLSNYSLLFSGTNGLYNKFWKDFLLWRMNTKLVKTTKYLTFNEILKIDFSKKYLINGVASLLKSIRFTIKQNSISPTIIEHYTCTNL